MDSYRNVGCSTITLNSNNSWILSSADMSFKSLQLASLQGGFIKVQVRGLWPLINVLSLLDFKHICSTLETKASKLKDSPLFKLR